MDDAELLKSPTYRTGLDLTGKVTNFILIDAGPDLAYAWGWYWAISGMDDPDYLISGNPGQSASICSNFPEETKMGFEDAKGTYKLRKEDA